MSLGAGTAVPPASTGSRAACCALWHFINSTGSALAPLPAPRHPLALAAPGRRGGGGGNCPSSGRLRGASAKEGVGARRCHGGRVFLACSSVPQGQRKRLILTLGCLGLGWCQSCPTPPLPPLAA